MNIIHMDLRVHRGFGAKSLKKSDFRGKGGQEGRRKSRPNGERLGRQSGAKILAEVTRERAEGVG